MNRKFHRTLASAFAGVILSCGAASVHAATITLDPLNATVVSGTTFNISVVGRDFTAGTFGGGFSLAWDPGILTLDSYSRTFPGDLILGDPGTLDNVAGTLTGVGVESLSGTAGPDFDIALLTFSALNVGISPTDVSIGFFAGGQPRRWSDLNGVDTAPTFVSGTVTVNPVPVPAAVWLFGSGLLGLIGVARRRNAT